MRLAWLPLLVACASTERAPSSRDTCEPPPATERDYPAGPYGVLPGEVMEDFTLEDCEGNPVRFGDVLAGAELVLFNVGAGWCAPCVEETLRLEDEVFRRYCGQGLAVVQVLFEDADARPATGFFCKAWQAQYRLTFPVVKDPLFSVERFFEDAATQTPLNLLVDGEGRILWREVGTAAEGLAAEIEARL